MRKLLITLLFPFTFSCTAQPSKIAIVIDDIGYRLTDQQVLTLPGEITFSFLPHTPYGKTLAEQAYNMQKEVLIHVPMESNIGKKLGPGALTSDMDEPAIRLSLEKSFQEIPFAIGINNHMGSYLTTLYKPMASTMKYLKDNELLFLDSVTSPQSKGTVVARKYGVPVMSRHVFLDNELSVEYITGQFNELVAKAKSNELAIGIAHPHPETIVILTRLIPTLTDENIELVKLSSLYKTTPKSPQLTTAD